MLRVLIADKLPEAAPVALREVGCEVEVDPALGGDTLTVALARIDPDVLVVRSTRVTAADLRAAGRLSLVVRAGAGVNTIDLSMASWYACEVRRPSSTAPMPPILCVASCVT